MQNNIKRRVRGAIFNEFLFVALLFLGVGLVLCLSTEKGQIVLLLNHNWTPSLDVFFKGYTYIGLGGVFVLFALVFMAIHYYYSLLCTISLVVAGLTSLLFKKVLFPHTPRPIVGIGTDNLTHIIPNLVIHSWGSYPSGHTLTAFCMATILALYGRQKGLGYVLFALAMLVGISRMYLLQHYFIDVYTGAVLGFVIPLVVNQCISPFKMRLNSNLVKDYIKRRSYHGRLEA